MPVRHLSSGSMALESWGSRESSRVEMTFGVVAAWMVFKIMGLEISWDCAAQ